MEKALFYRWGRRIYRYRRLVIVLWLLLFAGFAVLARQTPELLKDNGFTPKGSDSDRGLAVLQELLNYPSSSLQLVYSGDKADFTSESQRKAILSALEPLQKQQYVRSIAFGEITPLRQKGHVATVNVDLKLNSDEALDRYPEIRSLITDPAGMTVDVTGGTAILYDISQASKKDISKSEIIGLPIALIVLLIVFGTVPGALLPMVIGLVSVTVTLGLLYFAAQTVSLSNFLPNMVTMLGLAVGIDYALFMVSRFREELRRGSDVSEAVAAACGTAGKSIFFSGIAVFIGLTGMLFVNLNFYRSLCLGGISVVFVSALVGNTLLPALLGVLGHKVNALRVFPNSWRGKGTSSFWHKVAYAVMKRPLLLVLVISAVLIAWMIPLADIKLGVPEAEVLPPGYESRDGSDLLKEDYDNREINPVQFVVQAKQTVWDEATVRQIRDLSRTLEQTEGVKEVRSYLSALGISESEPPERLAVLLKQPAVQKKLRDQKLADGHTTLIAVIPVSDPDGQEAESLVHRLRQLDTGSLQMLVTGKTAYRVDIVERINSGLPAVLGFVMGVTYLALLLAFRSVILPLKAVLMNVLSLGTSLGIIVCVFQYGYLADVLRITTTGYVSATLPVLIFCVVFGISMDYEVFLISRIMEEYERTGDNRLSTAEGLAKTGSLITSAAFILVVVVGSFVFTDIEIIKALGLGLAIAILVDATVIRIVMVPALMRLLGKANWWAPRWLHPVRPRKG